MLSRSAQGVYWMARYLARAGYLSRLLELQVQFLVDRSVEEIHFGWKRIYRCMKRLPPPGEEFLPETEEFALADAFTLADDLTFERSNPDSVWSAVASGRENARQMRHCISGEMWTFLNLAWLRIRDLEIEDIWKVSPESFYVRTTREIDTFVGVADATMYRDEGWRFMQLGRFVERVQLLVALLLAQLATGRAMDDASESGWTSLLRACQAFDAYKRSYSVDVRPEQALELLVADPRLPGSLHRSLETLAGELAAIGAGPDSASGAAAERLAGRLCALIRYEWPDRQDWEALLSQVREHSLKLHDLVNTAYFDYNLEVAPVR